MIKNTVIFFTLVSAGLWQAAALAQSTQGQSSSPLAAYSPQIQEQALELIDKSRGMQRRINKVQGWLEKWEELASKCDNFSSANGTNFDSFNCKNYARSTRGNRMVSYNDTCVDLYEWRIERESELTSALGGNQNSSLAQATEAAIAQMAYEVDSICSAWESGGISPEYNTMVQLETTVGRPSHEFVMQFRRNNPGVYGGPTVVYRGGGFKQAIVIPLTRGNDSGNP